MIVSPPRQPLPAAAPIPLPAAQQPDWPDPAAVQEIVTELRHCPPIVMPRECDTLRGRLAAAAAGDAFVLQAGDCAETFSSVTPSEVHGKLRTITAMAAAIARGASTPVVKVGRMAGEYAKPRSHLAETRDGVTLPAYRGDSVNGPEFTAAARRPDPRRLKRMHHASASTLDIIRSFGERSLPGAEFFISHEALILPYEQALTRVDDRTGAIYDLSGHLLWIGERTRQLDHGHIYFAARIDNPVAVKLGPGVSADEAVALAERLNTERQPGRLTFITRFGADQIRDRLPAVVEKVADAEIPVLWLCDPMHGNTFSAPSGHKTREFDDVADEVRGFFDVHRALGTWPGGLHVELTGDEVTECVGGPAAVSLEEVPRRYDTACDPRLNRSQSLELAALVAELCQD